MHGAQRYIRLPTFNYNIFYMHQNGSNVPENFQTFLSLQHILVKMEFPAILARYSARNVFRREQQ